MADEIKLDRKAFKALSSDTRIAILKSLAKRRKMLAELSKEFSFSPSTTKEHMESLLAAGLVLKIDDGHKWKYYELSAKGRNVVNPGETRIWVVIGISAIALLFMGYGMMNGTLMQGYGSLQSASTASENCLAKTGDMLTTGFSANETAEQPPARIAAQQTASAIPIIVSTEIYAAGFIVFSLILGISLGYIIGKRRMAACSCQE